MGQPLPGKHEVGYIYLHRDCWRSFRLVHVPHKNCPSNDVCPHDYYIVEPVRLGCPDAKTTYYYTEIFEKEFERNIE